MSQYHKIQTVYKRDMENNGKTLLMGEYSLPEFDYLEQCHWIWSEKVDGTNIRIMLDEDGRMTFGGKTDSAQIPAHLVNALNDQFFSLQVQLGQKFPGGVILYGEGYGPKIQKGGGLYRDDAGFVMFDIRIGHWWLRQEDVGSIGRDLGIDVVPIVGVGTLPDMVSFVSRGMTSCWGAFDAEGVVARPAVDLYARNRARIITKLKVRDFESCSAPCAVARA